MVANDAYETPCISSDTVPEISTKERLRKASGVSRSARCVGTVLHTRRRALPHPANDRDGSDSGSDSGVIAGVSDPGLCQGGTAHLQHPARLFVHLYSEVLQARSKRSRFMTLSHAATKSRTNFSFESSLA